MQCTPIYSIGHSSHEIPAFLKLLKDNTVQVIADVRSTPYSRYVPRFNKKEITAAAATAGLKYVFMGDAIGGKPSDPHYIDTNSKVMYDKLTLSDRFQQGLDRLTKGLIGGWIIALLCAEENPLTCHRHHLIAREFELKRNIHVWHIRSDGTKTRAKKLLDEDSGQLKLF